MSKPLFGKILDPDFAPTRDAVHIPIVPAICDNILHPGEPIFLYKDGDIVRAKEECDAQPEFAVVDPFLKEPVLDGQLFYAWLRPESTQKLWHCFTHRQLDK